MPTTNPRIAVTLAPADYRSLQRLAALQGRPMSRIVAELVAELAPTLDRVADVVDLAAKAQASVKAEIRSALDEAEAGIVPHALAVADRFDAFRDELQGLATKLAPQPDRPARKRERTEEHMRPGGSGGGPRPVTTGATKAQRRAKGSAGSQPVEGCTCTVTKHERQENPACPVHFPRRAA